MSEEPIAESDGSGQPLRKAVLGLWRGFVDLITPPLCLSCEVPVTQGAALCLDCWQKLHFIDEPVCEALGTPFDYDEGEGALSASAIAAPPEWDRARAAVMFDEASQGLVHKLKYADTQEAGLAMARMMLGAGRKLLAEADVIVPVPLYRWRLWRRRFNQAGVLAQELSRLSGRPWAHDSLLKITKSRPQVGLSAEERRRNVKRVFAVPADGLAAIAGKRVVLVDDVRTTGATAGAAAAVLKAAGATQVDVLTFALVLAPSQFHIEA